MSSVDPDPWYASILSCPDCGAVHSQRENGTLWCGSCAVERTLRPNADFFPRSPKTRTVELPTHFDPESCLSRVALDRPEATYAGPRGQRDGSELLSVLSQTLAHPGKVLDLGCGPRDQAIPIMSLGHQYVGVDYSNAAADILADAHSLPFLPGSFDFVFSYAVLEHLHNPFLALKEIGRVLKPGGTMCGTVSQGEPFHNSFFHHTAWGLIGLCAASQFEVLRLWPAWDTLSGLSYMGRYSKPVKLGLRSLSLINSYLPFLSPRKMRWPIRDRAIDELHRAAAIGFVIRRQ